MRKKTKIPVTILSGYLGAGKTTLLNKLLERNVSKNIVVIENEYSEKGIDNELINPSAQHVFALNDGCICCSLSTHLEETLYDVLNLEQRPEHLIIETTGLADPAPVISSFLKDDSIISSHFKLDGVITIVDALNFDAHQQDDIYKKQIAMSNFVVLNKVAKVEDEELKRIKRQINFMNCDVAIRTTNYSRVDRVDLLKLDAYNLTSKFKPSNKQVHHLEHQHHHNHEIASHTFEVDGELDVMKFEAWMNLLMMFKATDIFRIKGVVSLKNVQQKYLIQSVHNQFTSNVGAEWGTEHRKNTLVFIGKDLDPTILQSDLHSCLST